jgi:hypothetical protein
MTVHLYTVSWNDAPMLDFFFRHYEPWVDRFFIFDDRSTDGTRDRLERHPAVQVATLERRNPESWVASALHFYNSAWRASRGKADWVVVTNIDEHLFHPDMSDYLAKCTRQGVTAIPALGYEMVSEEFPAEGSLLSRDLRYGSPSAQMSKMGIFDPNVIRNPGYRGGRHRAAPKGRVLLPPRDEVLNLHYRSLGLDYVIALHQRRAQGFRRLDLEKPWAQRYLNPNFVRERVAALFAARIDVLDPGRDHHVAHCEPRWWSNLPRVSEDEALAAR